MPQPVTGRLRLAGLFELIQVCETHRRDVALTVTERDRFATVYMQQGKILDAVCGGLRGSAAVTETFRWLKGYFELVPLSREPDRTIAESNVDILLAALRATEDVPKPECGVADVIAGDVALLSPVELLQLFEMNHRNAFLLFTRDNTIGGIHMRDGRPAHATVGMNRAQGDEALLEVLTWARGTFHIEFADWDVPPTVRHSARSLLMEASKRADEQDRDAS